jgi:hypothetical protein
MYFEKRLVALATKLEVEWTSIHEAHGLAVAAIHEATHGRDPLRSDDQREVCPVFTRKALAVDFKIEHADEVGAGAPVFGFKMNAELVHDATPPSRISTQIIAVRASPLPSLFLRDRLCLPLFSRLGVWLIDCGWSVGRRG